MKPLVSIVVPIYNVEKYLDKCIKSILNQTYRDLEIILVDDGSTDKCNNICDNYAEIDTRIKVIHQKNAGLSSARNTGISLSKGEYIYFVDSDDWIEENLIEDNISIMLSKNLDIIIFGFYEEWADKNIKKLQGNELLSTQEIKEKLLNIELEPCVWNKIYKKKIFCDIRFPVGQNMEDLYVIGNILKGCNKAFCNEKCYYHYNRTNISSITKNTNILKESYELFSSYSQLFFFGEQITTNRIINKKLLISAVKYAIKSFDINLLENKLSEKQIKEIINFLKKQKNNNNIKIRNRILILGILHNVNILNIIDGYCNIMKRKYKNRYEYKYIKK